MKYFRIIIKDYKKTRVFLDFPNDCLAITFPVLYDY